MSNRVVLSLVWCAACVTLVAAEASFSQDTYVNALQDSHQTDFGDEIGGGYHYAPPPNNNYLPTPTQAPVYGPPLAPVYGPPIPTFYKPAPPLPYHSHDSWLLDKIKSKISLFAIGKIVLKLLIFKKIVKFIGVICLLLFLPKLKGLFKDDMSSAEEDGMESKHGETERDELQDRIEELYDFVIKSITTSFEDKSA